LERSEPRLSIVIPTLNEESYVKETILHLLKAAKYPGLLEIMVVDAGSSDNTKGVVRDLPISWYYKPAFQLKKYASLNFGLKKAKAPIVQFLDADTLVPKGFDESIIQEIAKGNLAGAFEMRFLNADWRFFLLSKLNQIRYRTWKTCYGDQAIFCDKKAALEVGGFPETLMEAAYFCRRLKRRVKFKILNDKVLTSPRRFKDGGFWIVLWFDIRMWFRFIFERSLEKQSISYWEKNMKNG